MWYAAVDFDGHDTAGIVELNRARGSQNSIAAQAGNGDENAVFDARSRGVALDVAQGVIVAAGLGQDEAEIRNITGLRYRDCYLNRDAGGYLIAFHLAGRFKAN